MCGRSSASTKRQLLYAETPMITSNCRTKSKQTTLQAAALAIALKVQPDQVHRTRGVRPPMPRQCLNEKIRWQQCQAGRCMLEEDAPFNIRIRSGHRCNPNTLEENGTVRVNALHHKHRKHPNTVRSCSQSAFRYCHLIPDPDFLPAASQWLPLRHMRYLGCRRMPRRNRCAPSVQLSRITHHYHSVAAPVRAVDPSSRSTC